MNAILKSISAKLLAAAALACCAFAAPSFAQSDATANWPTRPVKLIVPFAPGAGADIGARLAANALSAKWKQSVIVENRPGGDSLIAIKAVIAAKDDHQLLFAASGNFTPHPYRHESLGYNRERDLLPVARFSNTIVTLAVASSLNVKTLPELIAVAKKRPNELNVVMVPGITEMVWDSFAKTENVSITKVPFTNVSQGASEMLSGRVHIAMAGLAIIQPVLQSGNVKLIAVTSRERVSLLPDVPTVFEAGVPSLWLEGLVGVFASPAMSEALRGRVGKDIADVARMPEIAERLAATGQVPNPGGADEFTADIVAQEKQVAEMAKVLGLRRLD
jgi:tripartite-type tricarboxylate transporter receptor subunit TctC